MRVLFINQHYYPEVAATGQLMADLAEDLSRRGFRVSIITGMPSYAGEVEREKIPSFERLNGVDVYRVFTTSFDRKNIPGRLVNYMSFFFSSMLKASMLSRYDVVVAMSTPPYLALIGFLLKKLKRSKFVYWVQDLYPDLAVEFGVIKRGGFLESLLRRLSKVIYSAADAVVAIGEKMAERLVESGVDKGKIRIIHNWADPTDFQIDEGEENTFRKELGLEDKFVVLYSGNMGVVHDFDTVLEGMLNLRDDERLAFLFIGDGVKKKVIEEFVEKNKLNNVYFLPYQPRERLKYGFTAGDVFLVTQEKRSAGLVVPSKVYAGLAAKIPVLAVGAKDSELYDVVAAEGAGIFIENGDAKGFIEAIRGMRDGKVPLDRFSEKGYEIFKERFSRSVAASRFENLLNELVA